MRRSCAWAVGPIVCLWAAIPVGLAIWFHRWVLLLVVAVSVIVLGALFSAAAQIRRDFMDRDPQTPHGGAR